MWRSKFTFMCHISLRRAFAWLACSSPPKSASYEHNDIFFAAAAHAADKACFLKKVIKLARINNSWKSYIFVDLFRTSLQKSLIMMFTQLMRGRRSFPAEYELGIAHCHHVRPLMRGCRYFPADYESDISIVLVLHKAGVNRMVAYDHDHRSGACPSEYTSYV